MHVIKVTEKELIQGCINNSQHCQEELFRRYSGKMLALCMRYARHKLEAEDLLQDGFIKVFKKLHTFRGLGSFEGWIRRIMVNTAIKNYKKMSYKLEQIGLEGYKENSTSPTVYGKMSEQDLINVINELPDGYRMVFNLYAIEGYKHQEIAKMLNIQESTSRSQLVKARRMLQKKLAKIQTIPKWKTNII